VIVTTIEQQRLVAKAARAVGGYAALIKLAIERRERQSVRPTPTF
jgi:hypothetical protein